jgi:hypothetical protein
MNLICFYCGVETVPGGSKKGKRPPNSRSVDHMIPRSRGGSHLPHNTVTCCDKCNQEKGSLTAEEYFAVLAFRKGTTTEKLTPNWPTKFVVDYQVYDYDNKTPVGRPTHFESNTPQGIISQLEEAHSQAARALYRVKDQNQKMIQNWPKIGWGHKLEIMATSILAVLAAFAVLTIPKVLKVIS